jgi:hypothetical protein
MIFAPRAPKGRAAFLFLVGVIMGEKGAEGLKG